MIVIIANIRPAVLDGSLCEWSPFALTCMIGEILTAMKRTGPADIRRMGAKNRI